MQLSNKGERSYDRSVFLEIEVDASPEDVQTELTATFLKLCRMPLLLLAVVFSAGCAATLPEVPPLGAENISLPGKVVWHDLVTHEMKEAKKFYAGLFD